MKQYLLIFPHAGAIRSNYAVIERQVEKNYEIIYIDYGKYINETGNLEEFIEIIWFAIKNRITRLDAEISIFAHSMGTNMVQILENRIISQYYINRIIYSDGEIIKKVKSLELKNKTEQEVKDIINKQFDIPQEINNNDALSTHFNNLLIRDLKIVDLISSYATKFNYFRLCGDARRIVVLSDYMNKIQATKDWRYIADDLEFIYVNGGHYTLLKDNIMCKKLFYN